MGLTHSHNIRIVSTETHCWDSPDWANNTAVIAFYCNNQLPNSDGEVSPTQHFDYREESRQIVHVPTDRCLEMVDRDTVRLVKCDGDSLGQKWRIRKSPWF